MDTIPGNMIQCLLDGHVFRPASNDDCQLNLPVHLFRPGRQALLPSWSENRRKTFLDNDYCAIEDRVFFVRGIIHLPIMGAAETFRWGVVWGSLSRENFETLLKMDDDPKRIELPPMFSWLSTPIPEYPDTLSLRMCAHIQELNRRPHFDLEPSDHPLSQEYHKGITVERVKKIMMECLRGNESKVHLARLLVKR